MEQQQLEKIRSDLERTLPPLVSRRKAVEATGDFFTERTLANLDSQQRGPSHKVRIGRQVAYPKEDFLNFFINRIANHSPQL